MSSYTPPRLDPLNDHQLRILRDLVNRPDGVPVREVGTSKQWSPITMHALQRRKLADLVCDRIQWIPPGCNTPQLRPVPGSWRWIATDAGRMIAATVDAGL